MCRLIQQHWYKQEVSQDNSLQSWTENDIPQQCKSLLHKNQWNVSSGCTDRFLLDQPLT